VSKLSLCASISNGSFILAILGAEGQKRGFLFKAYFFCQVGDDELIGSGLESFYIKVEPNGKAVSVDVVLQQQVVAPTLFVLEDAVQVSSFKVRVELQRTIAGRCVYPFVESYYLIVSDAVGNVPDEY
jgi:hypothetical protein